tara:strand:- start:1175 stop:1291 length:117 start_codon:yes stop_codon:yes gene_type:complete
MVLYVYSELNISLLNTPLRAVKFGRQTLYIHLHMHVMW